MAITLDTVSSVATVSGSTTSWSHTCSGLYRYLLVFITSFGTAPAVQSVTYNGIGLTPLGSVSYASGNQTLFIYGLIAPATGSNTILVTMTAPQTEISALASSWNGVHQTVPVGSATTYNDPTGTSPMILSGIVSAATEIVTDCYACYQETYTKDASQTMVIQQDNSGTLEDIGSSYKAGSASTTMQWTKTGTAECSMIAIPIKPFSETMGYLKMNKLRPSIFRPGIAR